MTVICGHVEVLGPSPVLIVCCGVKPVKGIRLTETLRLHCSMFPLGPSIFPGMCDCLITSDSRAGGGEG